MLVKITKAGDSPYRIGDRVKLDVFIVMVEAILKAGGEMPIAVLEP